MNDRFNESPVDLVATLKSCPDTMVVTPKFIAVWHTGLESAILIPGHFVSISDKAAETILNENLKALNAETIS